MKNNILLKAISMFLCVCTPAIADYKPPNGTENYYDFVSPTFYSGGTAFSYMETPQAELLNPAVSGLQQLSALDLSYMTLADLGGDQGWGGHVVNIGGSHPTKAGVFSWSARFIHSQMPSVDMGTIGAGNLSFAKALYEDLLIGVGIGGGVGINDEFGWFLEGDLGFVHFPDIAGLPDFRWGAVLRDFGKTFSGATGRSAYPSPFTPAFALGFTALDTKNFDLSVNADLSFPSVQNIRLGAGLGIKVFDTVGVSVSSTFDLREMIDPEIELGSFIPNFGLAVHFATDAPQSNQKVQSSAGPVSASVWGFGLGVNALLGVIDSTPPIVDIVDPEEVILSIGGGGDRDEIKIDVEIEEERFLYGYSFVIEDSSDEPVRTISSKFHGPARSVFRGIIERIGHFYSSIEFPGSFSWDGKDDNGDVISDGSYSYFVTAWDDNGNTGLSNKHLVHVDSTPPTVLIEPLTDLDRIFSPNNDGNKDTVAIEQDGSVEDRWIGTISADGKIYRTFEWEDGAPESFIWDGVTDDGTLANDGIYSYRISATDRAGNTSKGVLEDIILNSEATPLSLSINRSHFSPNGDGRYDDVEITAKIPITSGIKEWSIKVMNSSGQAVRVFSGLPPIPGSIVFDGLDENGNRVPEGSYLSSVEVTYINGNNPKSLSPQFVVDVTPPEANVTSDFKIFSPNGDGNKDFITFFQETSVEDKWTGEIYNLDGLAILNYSWRETADSKVSWDGHGLGGLIAPNGTYSYRIFADDRAGNTGGSREMVFNLNNEAATVFLSREFDAISPNGDRTRDAQRLLPQVSITEGIDTFALFIKDENDRVVRAYTGRASLDASYDWGGLADDGTKVADGEYYAQLEILYKNGNKPVVNTRPFLIDTIFPVVTSMPDNELFSPNGDGNKDTVTFRNSSSGEDLWEARIVGESGEIVRRVFWKDTVSSFVWDGTDDAGNQISDGKYHFEIFTTDVGGNYTIARSSQVNLDTRVTAIFVSADPERFSPNGDGTKEEVAFSTLVNEKYGAVSWDLSVMRSNGSVVKSFSGSRIPEKILWNGRNDNGGVEDGEYFAEFRVEYEMGNNPVARSDSFYIDVTRPEIDFRYQPQPFSPDDDGHEDLLEFLIEVSDSSDIGRWSLTIVDPKGKLFKKYEGTGDPPRRIYWTGKSNTGELVQAAEDYPFEFYVEDDLGNSTALLENIPVDVLVVRDGERLKIRISNITFEPNSPSLETEDRDVMGKNSWVLERIAGIFKKYDTYFIRIEGHAVSVHWDDVERAKNEQENELVPLSKARAETVKKALVALGIDADRIQVEGIGGATPIVAHGDIENRWKNRRVEFILLK
jgi:flagellar hook assembly protein FlgD/outer membrane protein OmpA-like peptidoglycan-associated protein